MNFASDNVAGAAPEVMEALVKANEGTQRSYGNDDYTARLDVAFSELFEREVAVRVRAQLLLEVGRRELARRVELLALLQQA